MRAPESMSDDDQTKHIEWPSVQELVINRVTGQRMFLPETYLKRISDGKMGMTCAIPAGHPMSCVNHTLPRLGAGVLFDPKSALPGDS
jgi:hypothetical protein